MGHEEELSGYVREFEEKSPHSEVLRHLVDASGRPFGQQSIMGQLLENEIRVVFIVAPPGQGKTTTLTQLAGEIERFSNGGKRPTIETFEANLTHPQVAELGDRVDWGRSEWRTFSATFAGRIEERIEGLGEGEILIVESPSVGDLEEGNDRGVSTLIDVTKKHRMDSFVIALVGDERIEKRALNVRRALSKRKRDGFLLSDRKVIDYLERHHQVVEGLEGLKPREAGQLVRRAVLGMDQWKGRHPLSLRWGPEVREFFEGAPLPERAKRLPEITEMILLVHKMTGGHVGGAPIPHIEGADTLRMQYLSWYFNRYLKPRLGVNPHQFKVLFNTFIPHADIHYLNALSLQRVTETQ